MQKVIQAGFSIWEEIGMKEKEGQEMAEDVTSIKGVHMALGVEEHSTLVSRCQWLPRTWWHWQLPTTSSE